MTSVIRYKIYAVEYDQHIIICLSDWLKNPLPWVYYYVSILSTHIPLFRRYFSLINLFC